MHAQRGPDSRSLGLNSFAIRAKEMDDLVCCTKSSIRSLCHALKKKGEPRLPVSLFPDLLQQAVVLASMCLEKKAEVEKRLLQNTLYAKKECDQKAADTPVAIEKRVNGFELNVKQAGANERRQGGVFMQKALEGISRMRRRERGRV